MKKLNELQSYLTRLRGLMLTLIILCSIGVGNVWGQASTHTSNVTLTKGTNGSTCKVSISGNQYDGIKMGTGSKTGSMSFSVPAGVTTVYVHAARWKGDGNATLKVTRTSGTVTSSLSLIEDAGVSGSGTTYTLSSPSEATNGYFFTLTLSSVNSATTVTLTTSSKRAVVWGVNTASATKTFTLAVPKGDGTYDETQTGQEKTALTETNAISAVSCGNGLNGTYANMWTSTAIGTPTYTYPSNVVTSSTADGDLPASGTTLYAVFTTNDEGKYTTNPVCNPACTNGTVSYAKGSTTHTGGNAINGSHANSTKVCSTNLTLPGVVFTTTGYTQDGWATSDGGSKIYDLSATNYATEGDATLYPHWTANKYTVTWSVNGSTYTTTENVTYNTKTSTPANPSVPGECTGSTFMGWTATENYTGDSAPGDLFNGTTPTITGNKTFYAVFADEN